MDQNSVDLLKKNLDINQIKPKIARQFNDRLSSMAISALWALVGTSHDYRPLFGDKSKSPDERTAESSYGHEVRHLIENLSNNIDQLNQLINHLSNR